MKKIILFFSIILFVGCNSKKEQKVEITPKGNFYKQSEMAALMLLMYETNAQNKQLILDGKQPKEFPEEFLKIHTAQLTDSTDRTLEFKEEKKISFLMLVKKYFSKKLRKLFKK